MEQNAPLVFQITVNAEAHPELYKALSCLSGWDRSRRVIALSEATLLGGFKCSSPGTLPASGLISRVPHQADNEMDIGKLLAGIEKASVN